ncbi:MAG: D-alanyl-D-alanine carboxypeptidase family protein [Pseudomonadota bacterium]
MRRFWTSVMALALAVLVTLPSAAEARRYASIVIDAATGRVLHEDHADRWVYPASLTKMMTLYMAFEALDSGRLTMTQMLPVSREAASRPPSKLGLRAGGRITVHDVISALVTRSANDAAVVMAEALGGSEARFAGSMTQRARELGLRATTFRNASGLPDERQRTTARDMAQLGLRLQRDFPHYFHYFSTRRFVYAGREHGNHNRLLGSYAGTDGIKTGYIRASGFNLVSSVERDGRRLIGVVIGGRTAASRNAHMVELLNTGFARAARLPGVVAAGPSPRRPANAPVSIAAAAPPANAAVPLPRLRPAVDDTETVQLVNAGSGAAGLQRTAPGQIAAPLRVVIAPAPVDADPPPPATAFVEQVDARTDGSFGVQIGAFDTAVAAHRAAEAALRQLPTILEGSAVEVSATDRDGQTLYRARRMGLPAARAGDACDRLQAQGIACFVLERSGLETRVVVPQSSG